MRQRNVQTRLTALLLTFTLLLTSCGSGASAASMHLRKTQGTVGVSDGEGKDITIRDNLGLYSGYQVATQAKSYAWIDLDSVKLTKMDANSEIKILKDDKELEINVESGSLFFNVAEPLADDESMNIVTSTMAIGIRGTCGWVGENTAALLEGTVEVTAGEQSVTINAGEMAVLTAEGTLEVKPFTAASVPAFVREEVVEDEKLAADIQDTIGMDLTVDPMAVYERIHRQDEIFRDVIDFQGDGNPELVVITKDKNYDNGTGKNLLLTEIFKNKPDGPDEIGQYRTTIDSTHRVSLMECDGRYLLGYIYESETGIFDRYCCVNDGLYEWSEEVVSHHYYDSDDYSVSFWDEQYNQTLKYTPEEYEAVMAGYKEVKVLVYCLDDITAVAAEP